MSLRSVPWHSGGGSLVELAGRCRQPTHRLDTVAVPALGHLWRGITDSLGGGRTHPRPSRRPDRPRTAGSPQWRTAPHGRGQATSVAML